MRKQVQSVVVGRVLDGHRGTMDMLIQIWESYISRDIRPELDVT